MKKSMIISSLAILIAACNTNKKNEPQEETTTMHSDATDEGPAFPNIQFASSKDTICGMSVDHGAADTLQFKGNVFGFCSTVCKNEFEDILVSENKR